MRHVPDAQWARLGPRFDRVRGHAGHAACFTCSAFDLLLGRPVMVRAIGEHAAAHERDLFEREAEALSRLRAQPAVLTLYERTRVGDLDVLVLQGAAPRAGTVRAMSPPDAVRLVVTLAGGVETAHRVGVLHGAIEPAAVLYDAGQPLLAGFCRRIADPQPPAVHSATSHTAPEVLLGDPVRETVDVYGLGSTLYELIAGHPAIRAYPGESPAALSLRVITGVVTVLDQPGVPFELVDVINWTLSVDPATRPPSVAWLAEELGRIERHQGWAHTRLQVGVEPGDVPLRHTQSARHRAG